MFPSLYKALRKIYFWTLHQPFIGRAVFNFANLIHYLYVKISGKPPRKDPTCLVIVSHKYKFIFLCMPKVASRSFMNYFLDPARMDEYDIEYYEQKGLRERMLRTYPAYFKFAFVRNPWSRILSCYNSKINNRYFGFVARILVYYKGLRQCMPFADFVHWLSTQEGSDSFADRHWLSQYQILSGDDGTMACDFVGKYETLEADLKTLTAQLNIPPIILEEEQRGGHTSKNTANYRENYTNETRDIIAKRYARDIELFDYEF